MQVTTKGIVPPNQRQSGDGSPQESVQKDRSSAVSAKILGSAKKNERRREAIAMQESGLEGTPPRVDYALLYQDINEYNVKVIHNYAMPYVDNVTGEEIGHHNKTAEWVLYHAFSLVRPTLIQKSIDKQYTHTGGRNGRYACKICEIDDPPCPGHVFRSSMEIRNHLRFDHNPEGSYCCKRCGQTFKRPPALYNHVQSSHYNEPEKLESLPEISVLNPVPSLSTLAMAKHKRQPVKPSKEVLPSSSGSDLAMPSTSGYVTPRIKVEVTDSPPQKRARIN